MALSQLLFIDTNVWLDFYRARSDSGLKLLEHVEAISNKVIVNYQLESEFKRNRQAAILEGMQDLKAPSQIPRLGIFSNAKATKTLQKNIKEAETRVKTLKTSLQRALKDPPKHDPVFKICQRIFHKSDALSLDREDARRHQIRRRAFKRFLHGCPPRKKNDTSMGDAFNWEWMIECAIQEESELVIVSRDSDYGIQFDGESFVNDHLKQEFMERVSKKRKILLYTRLSEGLKHFKIPITAQEENAESEIVQNKHVAPVPTTESFSNLLDDLIKMLNSTLPTKPSLQKNSSEGSTSASTNQTKK